MKKSLNDYINDTIKFANARGWVDEVPTELLTSTLVELGELSEHYESQKKFKETYTDEEKKMIGYEFVDVFFYLFRMAGRTGIDMDKCFQEKYKKLEEKYYIGSDPKAQHEKYRKDGKNKLYE
jgi:NTP pyrophosphatase (non-canonical NTP hydrolase)